MLVCDLCDTGYHTYCLDPPMSTIPKTGWKCLVSDCCAVYVGWVICLYCREYSVCKTEKGGHIDIGAFPQLVMQEYGEIRKQNVWTFGFKEVSNLKIVSKEMNFFCPMRGSISLKCLLIIEAVIYGTKVHFFIGLPSM